MTTRQQLRDDARRARYALTDRDERSQRIIDRLFALPEFEAAAVVLFVAAGIRVARRLQAARRDGTGGPGDGPPDDPGQPDPSDEPADVTA